MTNFIVVITVLLVIIVMCVIGIWCLYQDLKSGIVIKPDPGAE